MWLRVLFLIFILNQLAFSGEMVDLNRSVQESEYLKLNTAKIYSGIKKHAYLELMIENSDSHPKEFYFAIKDSKTKDYWGQFTFKTMLSPGNNKLTIFLDRKVGERGSHRYQRKLDKSNLKDVFVVFNPDKKTKAKAIKIKSLRFYNISKPKLPKGAIYFLFNEWDKTIYPFATIINDQSKYSPKVSAGFESLDLWRNRDAKIAPLAVSRSMAVNEATFSLDLPVGEYQYELNWNELGYWDVPFWSIRKLFVNGKPKTFQSRASWEEFLKDLFQFSDSEKLPFIDLMNYFKPIQGKIKHVGGKLSFAFEGDQTGVSLNTLMIYPSTQVESMAKFKEALNAVYISEFNAKYRLVKKDQKNIKAEVFLSDSLNQEGLCLKRRSQYAFIENDQRLRLCIQGYKGKKASLNIKGFNPLVYRFKYAYQAMDLNHESYTLRPDVQEILPENFEIKGNVEIIEIDLRKKIEKKEIIQITIGEDPIELPFKITYLQKDIDKLPVNIGFFGPSAIPKTYFRHPQKESWERRLNKKLVRFLTLSHVNFIVDPPEFSFQYNELKTNFDLSLHSEKNYFYASGEFKAILAGNPRNAAQDEESYYANLNLELKEKNVTYLFSDEASGYRDAIKEDTLQSKELKKRFPSIRIGGFGNLYDLKRAKSLYQTWDVGYYADLPDKGYREKLNKMHDEWGVYNLCAEINSPMKYCYGLILFQLHSAGVKNIIEWHLNSAQNFPYFDLDGREADIAFIKTNARGELLETYRFREFQEGLVIFKKLLALEKYLKARKVMRLQETKALNWLNKIKQKTAFPLKKSIEKFDSNEASKFYTVLDKYCLELLSAH